MAGTGRFGLASVLLGLWLLVSCTTPSRPVADPAGAPRVVEFVIGPNVDAPFDPNDPKWTRVSNPEIIEATMRRLVEDPVGDYPHLLLFRALQMVSLDRHGQVVDGYIFDGSAKARAPVIRAGAPRASRWGRARQIRSRRPFFGTRNRRPGAQRVSAGEPR